VVVVEVELTVPVTPTNSKLDLRSSQGGLSAKVLLAISRAQSGSLS